MPYVERRPTHDGNHIKTFWLFLGHLRRVNQVNLNASARTDTFITNLPKAHNLYPLKTKCCIKFSSEETPWKLPAGEACQLGLTSSLET